MIRKIKIKAKQLIEMENIYMHVTCIYILLLLLQVAQPSYIPRAV